MGSSGPAVTSVRLPEGRALSEQRKQLDTMVFAASDPTDPKCCPGILGDREGQSGPHPHPGPSLGMPKALLWAHGDKPPGGGKLALP